MSDNLELELSKQFNASRDKYIYFLLAVTASAIGFAITQLKVEPLQHIHILIGLSIGLWALSFISGLLFLEYATNFTLQNQNYLAFKRELRSYRGEDAADLLVWFKSGLDKTIEKQQSKMKLYGVLQSRGLLLGALLYIAWHVARMWAESA